MVSSFCSLNYKMNVMLVVFLVILAVFSREQAVAVGIRVEPTRFIFELEQGERATGAIYVTNNTERDLDITANYYDWNLNQAGQLITYRKGVLQETLQGLIKFNPRRFTLSPGEKQFVRFTVIMPGDQEARKTFERRGIIFFEHSDQFEAEGMGASVKTMVGVTLYVMPVEGERKFAFRGGTAAPGKDGRQWAALVCSNGGQVHLRFTLDYHVMDGDNNLLEEGVVEEKVILPAQDLEIFFPLQGDYIPGEYKMLLDFKFTGTEQGVTETILFTVKG